MKRIRGFALAAIAWSALTGCADSQSQVTEEKPEVPAELASYVLEEAPNDIAHPLYLDFNGKAELIGYALDPDKALAAPGSKLQLKLYWHSSAKISPGYKVFTHLVTPSGKRFPIEGGGPLRKGPLSPSEWLPGKVYIDELEVTVPEELDAARFSIVAGIWGEPAKVIDAEPPEEEATDEPSKKQPEKADEGTFSAVRLRVLSGLSDGKHGGIVATLETGVTPGSKRARAVKDAKRGAGAPQRRPVVPGMDLGALAAPADRPPPPAKPAQ